MKVSQSTWGKGWARENLKRPNRDPLAVLLLAAIILGCIFLVGLQLGLREGRQDAYQIARAEIWANHYEQYSRVQWLIDEADLHAMMAKR